MSSQSIELYNDGHHRCLSFDTLVQGAGIQSNQFLIIDGEHEALIDPGGELTFLPLSMEIQRHTRLESLDYILASHQDPDIISALGRWMERTQAQIIVSKLWQRFLPHLASNYAIQSYNVDLEQRIRAIDDGGARLPLGNNDILILPAHFLHSVGNFQFYDPVSKILFSGDMGASIVDGRPGEAVQDFQAHIPKMIGFHRRYMASNRACRLWANMVEQLDIDMIVPQHGAHFQGKAMCQQFTDWIAKLDCGIDLMTQANYQIPD